MIFDGGMLDTGQGQKNIQIFSIFDNSLKWTLVWYMFNKILF